MRYRIDWLIVWINTLTNWTILSSVTTNTSYKLHILGHDSNTLGMDGTQVGVLKKTYVVCLRGLLQGKDGRSLEPKISCLKSWAISRTKTLEGELADEKIGGLLVPTDLTKGNSSRSVTVGLLHTSGEAGRSYVLAWWRAAYGGLCLRWTYGRFVWYGPYFYYYQLLLSIILLFQLRWCINLIIQLLYCCLLFYSTKHKTVIIIIIIIIYYIVIYNCRPAANLFLYAAANIVMYCNVMNITRKRKVGSPKITQITVVFPRSHQITVIMRGMGIFKIIIFY